MTLCVKSPHTHTPKQKVKKNWACCWDTLGSGAEKDGKRFLPSKTRMLSGDFATGYLGSAICPCWIPPKSLLSVKKIPSPIPECHAKPGNHGELCMFRGRCQSNVTSSKARCLQIFRLPLQRLCYLGQPRGARRCRMVVKPKDFSWIMDCPKWLNADHANHTYRH